MHFLKVINFAEMDKPTSLFMHLLLQDVLEQSNGVDAVTQVFTQGFLMNHQAKDGEDNSKILTFVKGISEFMLGKFYLRIKRQHGESI